MDKCCGDVVLEKSAGEKYCREVLWRIVVAK